MIGMKKKRYLANYNLRIKIKSNPFSFWEVQPEYDFTDDYAKNENFYRFKNLGTNMYLCADNL